MTNGQKFQDTFTGAKVFIDFISEIVFVRIGDEDTDAELRCYLNWWNAEYQDSNSEEDE